MRFLKTDRMMLFQISLKVSREEHQKTEQLHLNDKKMLQDQLHTKDRQYQEILRNAKLQHSEAVERLRQSFEERAREIEKRYSDRYVTLRDLMQHAIEIFLAFIYSARAQDGPQEMDRN